MTRSQLSGCLGRYHAIIRPLLAKATPMSPLVARNELSARDQVNPEVGTKATAASTSTSAKPPTVRAPKRHHRVSEGSACSMCAILARRHSRPPGIAIPMSLKSSCRGVVPDPALGNAGGAIVETNPGRAGL